MSRTCLGMASVGNKNNSNIKSRSRAQGMSEAGPPRKSEEDKERSKQEIHTKMEGASAQQGGGKVALCCFLGIFISYFIYGLLQEKM